MKAWPEQPGLALSCAFWCLTSAWCACGMHGLSVQKLRVKALQLDLGLQVILTLGEQMEKGEA